jgi:hypothetical protein
VRGFYSAEAHPLYQLGGTPLSDIFISYAKADRNEALKLSAYLESLGYGVWWDRGLQSGDEFRDVIIAGLAKARAVIVIWSPSSIRSDWVRSEAGRAHADRKLIPLRASGIDYKDIPPPFDVLHTEPLGNLETLRAAIIGQLAKPHTPTSAFTSVRAGLKFHALSWFGIFGTAITLFTGLKGVIELADWARWLIDHWVNFAHMVWKYVFGFLGITIPRIQAVTLSFLFFCTAMVVGSRVRPVAGNTPNVSAPKPTIRQILLVIACAPLAFVIVGLIELTVEGQLVKWAGSAIVTLPVSILQYAIAQGAMFETIRRLLKIPAIDAFGMCGLFMAIFFLLFVLPMRDARPSSADSYQFLFMLEMLLLIPIVPPIVMLLVGRPRPLLIRLSLAVVGLVVLLALNKLSTLGLDLRAPKSGP